MRIVVVEDEPNTRNGIIKIIEKYTNHEVIARECDGKKGFETVCSLRPDVVITDIHMPNMGGLDMIHKIREAGLDIAAIVLTGYSEFEYAQRAIQLSVTQYLLKPLNVDDIVEVLHTVEEKLSKNKVEKVSAEQLLFSILTGVESNQELAQRQFADKLRHQSNQRISMFLIQSESILEDTTNQTVDILQNSMHTICLTGYFIFKLPYQKQLLIMITDGQNVNYLKTIFGTQVIKDLKKKGDYLISYGEINHISELKKQLKKMQEYAAYTFLFPESCIIDQERIEAFTFQPVTYPEYLEHAIRRDIKNGNKDGIRKAAQKFEKMVIHSKEEPQGIKNHTVRFVMAALETARELMETKKDMKTLYRYLLNDMMKTSIREKFLNNYWKMMEMLVGDKEEEALTNNGMILNVIDFIRNHYEKEISLSEAADLVGITPEYLSKLFSKEMGINFSTFLGEFRISVAKKLLATGNYKIYEVAEMVGYKDTKYFNKVFRSIMGVSPSNYRKGL